MSRCCSQCGSNGHNSRTCGGSSAASGGGIGGSTALGCGGGEIILFGVRVKVDPMRKSVSMNNLSEYELPNNLQKNSINSDESAKAADDASGGYASADDAVPLQSTGGRDRKRGVPWTEEEHKLFLLGLQKVGKGDWRGISRNFVKTRTPTQVASHAQKYYLRRTNLNRRRRRSSLFDITTDSVTGMVKEGKSHEDNNTAQAVLPATSLPPAETSNFNGFSVAPFPVSVGPILVPVQVQNPLANITIHQGDNWNSRSALLVRPAPVVIPVHNSATPAFLNLNQRVEADSPLSLRLSLSSDQSQSYTSHSAFQVMPSYNNGDSITVA